MRKLTLRILALLSLLIPGQVGAAVIYTYNLNNSVTSAGPLPATSENLVGLFPDEILGNLGPNLNAVNVFEISIMEPLDFSALSLNGGAHYAPDPELFVFDASGRAVYGNDDISAVDTFSCLPSKDAANPCPVTSAFGPVNAGIYYLAITRSNQMPQDLLSNYLFQVGTSTDIVGPDLTSGGAKALAGWDGGAYNNPDFDNSYYAIQLTGTVPEPGTFVLFSGAGICGLILQRLRARRL